MRTILFTLLLVMSSFGQGLTLRSPLRDIAPVAAAGASYLIQQDFEGTGYDHGETWTPTGTVDPDFTGTVLAGSQSLNIAVDASYTVGPTFAGQSTAYFYCLWRYTGSLGGAGRTLIVNFDNSIEDIGLYINNSGKLELVRADTVTVLATGAATLSGSTVYSIWVDYVSGGTTSAYIATSATKPSADLSAGTSGYGNLTAIGLFQYGIGGASSLNFIFDTVRVSASTIGSNPP